MNPTLIIIGWALSLSSVLGVLILALWLVGAFRRSQDRMNQGIASMGSLLREDRNSARKASSEALEEARASMIEAQDASQRAFLAQHSADSARESLARTRSDVVHLRDDVMDILEVMTASDERVDSIKIDWTDYISNRPALKRADIIADSIFIGSFPPAHSTPSGVTVTARDIEPDALFRSIREQDAAEDVIASASVDSSSEPRSGTLRDYVNEIVRGMNRASRESRQGVDAASQFVDAAPDTSVQGGVDGGGLFLGGKLTLTDQDGQHVSFDFSFNGVDGIDSAAENAEVVLGLFVANMHESSPVRSRPGAATPDVPAMTVQETTDTGSPGVGGGDAGGGVTEGVESSAPPGSTPTS